jgi:hypothetical protein
MLNNKNQNRKHLIFIFSISIMALLLQACKKELITTDTLAKDGKNQISTLSAANSGSGNGFCWEDREDGSLADSILKPTILGAKLLGNPYSVANMSQAFRNLTNSTAGVSVNAWYIRVKPSNYQQLVAVEDLDVDWFDYPLDYELIQEGDYYDDGVTPAEEIPWLYAVVAPNFTPPAGISYQLLESIHVPDNFYLENEAFRITGNHVDTVGCNINSSLIGGFEVENTTSCDCDSRPSALSCECRSFCGFDTRNCIIPLPTPPPTSIPAGAITVTDDVINDEVPIRKVRMVARRFLKVDRTFTNANGNYTFTRSFNNKVTILIKFKNNDAIVKGLRGARVWQILMPVKINLGKFRGNINNLPHNVDDNNEARRRGARHWAAATTHNAVQEYRNLYAPTESIGVPPTKLRILIVPGNGAGSAPMFAKRFISTLPDYFIRQFMLTALGAYPLAYINTLATVLAGTVDVTIGYNRWGNNVTTTNDAMAELCFHEFTHAAHYAKVGNTQYGNFIQSSINEIIANFNTAFSPYGQGNTGNSPIIALYESWAFHMGHWLTNRKYGTLSGQFAEQGNFYWNNFPVNGLNSNLNLLEDFDPNRLIDPFRWIPQGLFNDMIDARNETTPIIDNVLNCTNHQFFNALDADINSLQLFRVRFLLENPNAQTNDVTNLFAQYNY